MKKKIKVALMTICAIGVLGIIGQSDMESECIPVHARAIATDEFVTEKGNIYELPGAELEENHEYVVLFLDYETPYKIEKELEEK